MTKFHKRTADELDALECADVTRSTFEHSYLVRWSDDKRFAAWHKMPGAQCNVYRINYADLRCESDTIEADDWRHLCSIIGLKEALARVFYRVELAPRDFEAKPYHMPICPSPAGAGNDHPECTC